MKTLVIVAIFAAVLFAAFSLRPVLSEAVKNPNFATREEVQTMIQKAVGDKDSYAALAARVSDLESRQVTMVGAMQDQNNPALGTITYAGNANEFSLSFLPTTDMLGYANHHDYRVVYRKIGTNPGGWCGTTTIPGRPPYNLFMSAGTSVYYKINDFTANSTPCF